MQAAVDNLDRGCPGAEKFDSCGGLDDRCLTAIKYLESGKLGPPPADRMARYQNTIKQREVAPPR